MISNRNGGYIPEKGYGKTQANALI